MEIQPLNDPNVFPNTEVLEKVLGEIYPLYMELMNTAASQEYKLNPEWRYYKDGKAWLCKITFKKKTVAWLSVWSDCFKVAFYFTERTGAGIPDLNINDSLKEYYFNHKPIGKLKPLVVETRLKSQLGDIKTLLKYKIKQL